MKRTETVYSNPSFRPLLKSKSEWVGLLTVNRLSTQSRQRSPVTRQSLISTCQQMKRSSRATRQPQVRGACLLQKVDGVERPIAFASRVLSPAERKYSASERKGLACLRACERWHFYLYGRRSAGDQVIAHCVCISEANALARVVCQAPWSASATELRRSLHWLPIRQRVVYKLAVLTFRTRSTGVPSYLASLIADYAPLRHLRSSDQLLLRVFCQCTENLEFIVV
jgi:hypothetical protein